MSKRKYKVEDVTLREVNSSKKYYTGSRHQMKSGEWITVEGQCDIETPICKGMYVDYKHFVVSFVDGYKCVTLISCICLKKIKNPFSPIVHGVGFFGEGKYRSSIGNKKTNEYNVWAGMLERCYTERNPTYKDCTVDPRWHNFQNFCEDIQELEGYAEWKNSKTKKGKSIYELDKDVKQQGVNSKIYSKNTCLFITHHDNMSEMVKRCNITGKTYTAHRLYDDYEEEFTNQTEFALKYNLHQGHITSCISGKRKTHKGWIFKTKDESNG